MAYSTNSSSNSGVNQSSSSNATGIVPGMQGVYGQLLGLNQNNYSNVLNAFTKGSTRLNQQLPSVYQGYGDLNSQVAKTLGFNGDPWGVAKPAEQAIERTYAQQQGSTKQAMINAGLGNSTVLPNMLNQGALQKSQALGGLGAQLAQTYAGYQSQLGLAGLSARMQGLGMQTGLQQNYMGDLAHYQFANTAGGLTGSFGGSQSSGQNAGSSNGFSTSGGGGSGGGGGGRDEYGASGLPGVYYGPNQLGGIPSGYAGVGGQWGGQPGFFQGGNPEGAPEGMGMPTPDNENGDAGGETGGYDPYGYAED